MQPLPVLPKTFRDIVEADLRRGALLMIKAQDEIDWQFRIATREGDYHLAVTMSDDEAERAAMLGRVALLMTWKAALAYTLTVETSTPDAIYAVGMSHGERYNCLARITRTPRPWTAANLSTVEWLPAETISPALVRLLSARPRPLRPKDIAGLQPWFGADGKFPAVHVPTGEVRGV